MKTETFQMKSNNKTLYGEISLPEKLPAPAVILLHGFTNNIYDCPINKDLFKNLPQKGFIAVQFDFIGSGESEGEFKDKTLSKMYNNFTSILEKIKQDARVTQIGVVGKSVAGLFPVMSNDKRINSSALLSTAIKPTVQFYRIWKNKEGLVNFGINASGKIKGVFALTQDFFTELENIEKKSLENLPKIKNLIHFQGTNDSSVPFEQGCILGKIFWKTFSFGLF